jgi:hypothetical protein
MTKFEWNKIVLEMFFINSVKFYEENNIFDCLINKTWKTNILHVFIKSSTFKCFVYKN